MWISGRRRGSLMAVKAVYTTVSGRSPIPVLPSKPSDPVLAPKARSRGRAWYSPVQHGSYHRKPLPLGTSPRAWVSSDAPPCRPGKPLPNVSVGVPHTGQTTFHPQSRRCAGRLPPMHDKTLAPVKGASPEVHGNSLRSVCTFSTARINDRVTRPHQHPPHATGITRLKHTYPLHWRLNSEGGDASQQTWPRPQ